MAHSMNREKRMNRMNDLISRQAAIDAMERVSDSICAQQAIDALADLPSAERRGRWDIELDKNRLFYECKCSVCGHIESFDPKFRFFNYCPNCGASMEGEQE